MKKNNVWKWPITITILTFFIACAFSLISDLLLQKSNLLVAFFILFFFVLLGIVADIIGIAVTAANPAPFHSMAANKVKGAKTAVMLVNNASKVSNILNDVVGDICGIICGSTVVFIVLKIAEAYSIGETTLITVAMNAVLSAIIVGGKALGKHYALNKTNEIVKGSALVMSLFTFKRNQ